MQAHGLAGEGTGFAVLMTAIFIQAVVHQVLSAYRQFIIERRFGFGRITIALFLRDSLLQGALLLLAASILAWASIDFLNRWGATGWAAVWILWVVFSWVKSWGYPVMIAPLFNRFTRLDDTALVEQIEALMVRARCNLSMVQVMDGSRRSRHGNAHVAGLGRAKRVVVLDTLLTSLTQEEVVAVLAHELGHISHGHIAKYEAIKAMISGVWIIGAGLLLSTAHLSVGMALTTLWLATPVFGILSRPLMSQLARRFEFQADAFVVAHDNPHALSSALSKLHKHNASPQQFDRLFGFIYSTHPSLSERLARLARQ